MTNKKIFDYIENTLEALQPTKNGTIKDYAGAVQKLNTFKPDDDIVIYQNKNKPTTPYYIFNNRTGSKGLILPVKSVANKTE